MYCKNRNFLAYPLASLSFYVLFNNCPANAGKISNIRFVYINNARREVSIDFDCTSTMKCIFVVAVIAWFVSDGTTVNAQPFGDPELHRGFHGHGSISHVQTQISSEHPRFRFFGICSRPHRHGHRRLPDFLKNVTQEVFKEFCDIVKNENLTKAQLEQQLTEWAQKQGGDVEVNLRFFPQIIMSANIFSYLRHCKNLLGSISWRTWHNWRVSHCTKGNK